MGIAAVYFLVAAGSSLLILNTLRPQRALAALKSEPPKPADPWPVLQPLLDGWRSTERMLGKVGGLLYSALAGLIVMNASNPAWVRSLVSLTVLYVGSVALEPPVTPSARRRAAVSSARTSSRRYEHRLPSGCSLPIWRCAGCAVGAVYRSL